MKFLSSKYVAIYLSIFYLVGAAIIGSIAEKSRLYNYWIWLGITFLIITIVVVNLYRFKTFDSYSKFLTFSFLSSVAIIGLVWSISLFLPDAYVIQVSDGVSTDAFGEVISPAGTVIDIENYDVAIPISLIGLSGIVINFIISIIYSFYFKVRIKQM